MFDIAELEHMVCTLLDRHALAMCTRVNNTWYVATMPYLMSDIPKLSISQQEAFLDLVLEDYCQTRDSHTHHLQEPYQTSEYTQESHQYSSQSSQYSPDVPREANQLLRDLSLQYLAPQKDEQSTIPSQSIVSTSASQVLAASQVNSHSQTSSQLQLFSQSQLYDLQVSYRTQELYPSNEPCPSQEPYQSQEQYTFQEIYRSQEFYPSQEFHPSHAQVISQPESMFRPTALSTFGHFVRTAPATDDLLEYFSRPPTANFTNNSHPEDKHQLTEEDLLRHFLSQCPGLRYSKMQLDNRFRSQPYLNMLAKYILPTTTHLTIDYDGSFLVDLRVSQASLAYATTSAAVYLLANTTSVLQTLRICSEYLGNYPFFMTHTPSSPDYLSGLMELQLDCTEYRGSPEFWTLLWYRCRSIERLILIDLHESMVGSLEKGIHQNMKNLRHISFGKKNCEFMEHGGDYYYGKQEWKQIKDEDVAALLRIPQISLQTIQCNLAVRAESKFAMALRRHYLTLTELTVTLSIGHNSYLIEMLSSCPNLCKLITIRDGKYPDIVLPTISAKRFVDIDPKTRTFRPWACEQTLKVLQARISKIPPNAQAPVYSRLARLVHLETLWLGHHARMRVAGDTLDTEDQNAGLLMTLASGLDRLAALKNLRELNLYGLNTEIDVEEVEWMMRAWPHLDTISGLLEFSPARIWLKKNYPSLAYDN